MRTISAQGVNAVRGVVVWALRAVSIVLLATGAYLVLKKVLFGIGTGRSETIYDIYMEIGEGHDFYRGLGMLAVGAALGAASTRIARWVTPVPPTGCPRCGYAAGAAEGRCPECGLPVGENS